VTKIRVKTGLRKNKKAFSAIIASLILMLLAVAGGVVVYGYAMGWIGEAQQNPTIAGKMQIDSIVADRTHIIAYVRNIGGVNLVLNKTYVNGNFAANGTAITDATGNLPIHATAKLDLRCSMQAGRFYEVSIVCKDGTTIVTSVQAKNTVIANDGTGLTNGSDLTITALVTLSSPSGHVGDIVTLTGSGFHTGKVMTITFNGNPIATSPATVASSGSGAFTATITIPENLNGKRAVAANDGAGSTNSSIFEVKPLVIFNPAMGHVGDRITVTGTGFRNQQLIIISYDKALQTTTPTKVITDSIGSFTATFVVPASVNGTHTVRSSEDETEGKLYDATFIVTPHISLSPTSGAVGSTVTVTGTGFAALRTMAVTFDGSLKGFAVKIKTDITGSFTDATLLVPSSSLSSVKTVDITGAYSNSASDTYTVSYDK
jgi:hypothetical protein